MGRTIIFQDLFQYIMRSDGMTVGFLVFLFESVKDVIMVLAQKIRVVIDVYSLELKIEKII